MLDVSQASAILKKTYPGGVVDIDYRKSKTLSLLKKNKGSMVSTPFGESFDVPVKHGNPQAGSATYGTGYAQAPNEQSRYSKWIVTPATVWHFADVAGDITRRGASTGSFVDAMASEIENAKDAMRRIMEIILFKGGFGDLARLSSTAAVGSATGVALENKWMVRFVEKGMSVVFANSEGASVLKGTTPVKVTGRSVSAGTLNFSAAPNQAGTLAAVSDYMFRDGDRQNSGTPSRLLPTGFKAWLPQAAPGSTAFHGLDRTLDDRLGGLRHDASLSGSIEEAFMDGSTLVSAEGGEVSHYVMGPETYNKIAKSLAGRIEPIEMSGDVGIGVKGFRLKDGSGAMFYSDNACEEGLSYGYNIEDIEIRYAGEDFCYLEQKDGMTFRRVAGQDLWRAELVSCWNFILPAPGQAVVIFNL